MAESKVQATAEADQVMKPRSTISFIDRALGFLSSVKLGITLMLLLVFFSMMGTFIIQSNIDGFDKYYAALTPAQRQLYGTLGLFNLFHTRWFTALLCLFSLNLVLVSIDLFPKAWRYVAVPKLQAIPSFLKSQPLTRSIRVANEKDLVDRVTEVMRAFHWRVKVTEGDAYTTLFGERGVWNRFMVFIVHIAILIIIGAAFVGSQWGYEGVMPLAPGETANAIRIAGSPVLGVPERAQTLPFQVVCSNLRVDLRDPEGPLAQGNFDNWYTEVTFVKGEEKESATVYLNHPFDYEGYRFFQASFGPPGEASDVVLEIARPDGSSKSLQLVRNKPVTVEGLGEVTFVRFMSDFGMVDGQPKSVGQDYKRPAAQLQVVTPTGETYRQFAFSPEIVKFIRGQAAMAEKLNVKGFSFTLKDFTRAPTFHVLQVQYDPGIDYTYFGYFLLCAALISVFAFSHERVWVVIDRKDDEAFLHLGGHANRNPVGLEKKFNSLVERLAALAPDAPSEEQPVETIS